MRTSTTAVLTAAAAPHLKRIVRTVVFSWCLWLALAAGAAPARQSIEDFYGTQQPPYPALWVIANSGGVRDVFTDLRIPTILAILKYELATSTWSGLKSGFLRPGLTSGPGVIHIPTDANIQQAIQEILNDPALKLLYTDDQSLLIHSSGAQTLTQNLFLINRGGFYSGQGVDLLPPEQLGKHIIHELGHVFQERNWQLTALHNLLSEKETLPEQLEAGLPLDNLSKRRVDEVTQLLLNRAKETVTKWDWSTGRWSTDDERFGTITFTKIGESEARPLLAGSEFGGFHITCPPPGSDTEFFRGEYTASGGTGKIIGCADPTAAILDGRFLFVAKDGTRTTGFFRALANLKTNKPNRTFTAEYAADSEFVSAAESASRDTKSLGRSLKFSALKGTEECPAKTQAISSAPAAVCPAPTSPAPLRWKLVSVAAKTPENPDGVPSFSFPGDSGQGYPAVQGNVTMNVPAMIEADVPAPVSATFTGALSWNKGGSSRNEAGVVSLSVRSSTSGVLDPSACFQQQDLGKVKAGSSAGANVTVSCQWTVTDFGSGQDTVSLDASGTFAGWELLGIAGLTATYQRMTPGTTPGTMPGTSPGTTPSTSPETPLDLTPETTPETTPPATTGKINLTLTLSAATVKGGTAVTGTVTLSQPAPAGGVRLILESDTPNIASVPGTLTIPAGAASGSFPITTSRVSFVTDVSLFVHFADALSSIAGDPVSVDLSVKP